MSSYSLPSGVVNTQMRPSILVSFIIASYASGTVISPVSAAQAATAGLAR